jgi:hypothetical protein
MDIIQIKMGDDVECRISLKHFYRIFVTKIGYQIFPYQNWLSKKIYEKRVIDFYFLKPILLKN